MIRSRNLSKVVPLIYLNNNYPIIFLEIHPKTIDASWKFSKPVINLLTNKSIKGEIRTFKKIIRKGRKPETNRSFIRFANFRIIC